MRRPAVSSPSEGPFGDAVRVVADPTVKVGGVTFVATEAAKVIPVRPMPDPAPPAHRYVPWMVARPASGPYVRSWRNVGGFDAPTPLASLPRGRQTAVPLRVNFRRPSLVEPGETLP